MRLFIFLLCIGFAALSVGGVANETVTNETTVVVPLENGTNVSLEPEGNRTQIENVCDIALMLEIEKEVYNMSEKISFWNRVSNKSFGFLIEYWIEDAQGNVVKAPVQTANTNKKQFTPDFDVAEISLKIKNKLVWVPCNNTNTMTENVKQLYVVNPNFVEEIEEVVVPTPVRVATRSTTVKKQAVNRSEETVELPVPKKNVTSVSKPKAKPKAEGKEYTSQVQISSRGGERVINATPTSLAVEDLIYVGSSERSRSLIPYILGGVLVIVIIGLVIREWRS